MTRCGERTIEHSQEFGTNALTRLPELYDVINVSSRVNSVELWSAEVVKDEVKSESACQMLREMELDW